MSSSWSHSVTQQMEGIWGDLTKTWAVWDSFKPFIGIYKSSARDISFWEKSPCFFIWVSQTAEADRKWQCPILWLAEQPFRKCTADPAWAGWVCTTSPNPGCPGLASAWAKTKVFIRFFHHCLLCQVTLKCLSVQWCVTGQVLHLTSRKRLDVHLVSQGL